MLVRMPSDEIIILSKGIVAMLLFIMIGVAAAEHQLNDLTLQSSYVRSFNVQRDHGGYSAHILGNGMRINALYPVGTIHNSTNGITLQAGGYRATIPTILHFNIERPIYWLTRWYGQFTDEALRTKENLISYLQVMKPLVDKEIRWLKEQFR